MIKNKTSWWNDLSDKKRHAIVFWGLLLGPYVLFFAVCHYPVFRVNRNPVLVEAKITYVYHYLGGGKGGGGMRRVYKYVFNYNGKTYYGKAKTYSNVVLGDIGDTLIIRCNKNKPEYSVFQYTDNPHLKERKLTWKEDRELLKHEPDEYGAEGVMHGY